MILDIFGLVGITFTDVLDILLVALIIYLLFRWIRKSSAINVFFIILAIYILMVIAEALNMKMMSKLVSTFIDVGVVALIVIFQPEIRHFIMNLGSGNRLASGGMSFIERLLGTKRHGMEADVIGEITEACRHMSAEKVGALIVFRRRSNLEYVVQSGDNIDARISERLIRNIFFKNSPLHDGAMIIDGSRIVAARCTLPITDRTDIPAALGMRHRAAIGITEQSDAVVVVVSEETGGISFVKAGKVTPANNINSLKLLLSGEFSSAPETPRE